MRMITVATLLIALALPVMAQTEPLNHFIGYGYINTALPIHNVGDNAVTFTFMLCGEKRKIVTVPCIARGQVAEFIKALKLKRNEIFYFVIDGRLIHRHSSLCVAVISIILIRHNCWPAIDESSSAGESRN